MMLLLDSGNSRCKWVALEQGVWRRQGVVARDELALLVRDFAVLDAPARILVANVAGPTAERALRAACARWPVAPEFLQAQAAQCGVRNGYRSPHELGIDRWSALLAAWHMVQGSCLVVNCGTATTIDALSAQGEFLGGLILPGLELMHRSLRLGTAQIEVADGQLSTFPQCTADAITSGALLATAGAVELQRRCLGRDVPCLLSGGAAPALQPLLGAPVQAVENLVLRGLQRMAEEGSC